MNMIIGIVIVSYSSADELGGCINAARHSAKVAGLKDLIIVVDNNSKDNSISVAKKNNAAIIANQNNCGFAAAVNQGIKKAFVGGANYIIVLNPDVTMHPNAIKYMLRCFEVDEGFGAVGPSLVSPNGNDATSGYYQKAPSWLSVALFSTFLRPYAMKHKLLVSWLYEYPDASFSQDVEQVPGGCLMTSRHVLNRVGLLDEDFAIWFEDVEWCYRARQKGYRLRLCAEAKVEHIGGKSFEQWQDLNKAVTFYVSMKTFFNKHKPFSGILVRLALIVNSLALYIKNKDGSNLVFIKRFLFERRGKLPQ